MDVDLHLHGRPITSVFELLGTKENDITYSVGWALAQSPTFRRGLLAAVFPGFGDLNVREIKLQHRGGKDGITDIELIGDDVHAIFEAKRGWEVPSEQQLTKYAARLSNQSPQHRRLIALSECTSQYAGTILPRSVMGISVSHMRWHDIEKIARIRTGTHAEKRLMQELRTYIGRIVKMQDQQSNLVYVVALGSGSVNGSRLSSIDIVERLGVYMHPLGGSGWPKEPPNYMGFRYGGCVQRIHHVDAATVIRDFRELAPELGSGTLHMPHLRYQLGPAIFPPHPVKSGKIIRNTRVWTMLDLLLTCSTLSEASEKTKARHAAGN